MLEAASRYKETLDASMARATSGRATTPSDIIELHQATLGLMWSTHTTTLKEALVVLSNSRVRARQLQLTHSESSDLAL
jgi:hypothetical protein